MACRPEGDLTPPAEAPASPPAPSPTGWQVGWSRAPNPPWEPTCEVEVHPASFELAEALASWSAGPFDASVLQDDFRLAALDRLRTRPLDVRCASVWDADEDTASSWIRRAAELLDDPADTVTVPSRESTLDAVLAAMGQALDRAPEVLHREVPPGLEPTLANLLWSVLDAVTAPDPMPAQLDPELQSTRPDDWWVPHGGSGLLYDADGEGYTASFPPDRAVLERRRGRLYGAAVHLAKAVEASSWPHAPAEGLLLDVRTPRGRVVVRGTGDDVWTDAGALLLSVDLGGDDVYTTSVGANQGAQQSVSVHIDVRGDDIYAYPGAEVVADPSRLPPDAAGRFDLPPHARDISASTEGRQGSGRAGIGLLFDLGGNDSYRSLRASQGYAHHGVGVLYDAAGDDDFWLEDGGQGTGQYGVGLLIDRAGDDHRRALSRAQGLGFVGGFGALVDGGGNDAYACSPKSPLAHPAPQDDGANVSLCQGAGFGWRDERADLAMSGGFGWLLDRGGHDRYEAGVYAQGVGYWQGVGLLDDRAGHDEYDAVYYARGSGVHFGVGALVDGEGDDRYGLAQPSPWSDGSGHDYGLGIVYDAAGRDELWAGPWSGGAGSCGGVGLRLDAGGDDRHVGGSAALGAATTAACPDREAAGLFWDGSGRDDYEDAESRGDEAEWGHALGAGARATGCDVETAEPLAAAP